MMIDGSKVHRGHLEMHVQGGHSLNYECPSASSLPGGGDRQTAQTSI